MGSKGGVETNSSYTRYPIPGTPDAGVVPARPWENGLASGSLSASGCNEVTDSLNELAIRQGHSLLLLYTNI